MTTTPTRYADLAAAVSGPVLVPGDPTYDEELAPFNAAARHTPDVAVAASSADDVAHAVRWAAARGWPVGVQATGHGTAAGYDHGMVISTRHLQSLHIDPETRLARIGAGVRWRAVIDRAEVHGLAPLNGSSSDVGAVGYTVGGGLPVLGRTFGFAADLVRELEVVTADGRIRTATADREPDLFDALRGGKPDLGIVTSLTMELVPVSTIYGGCVFYDGAHARELLHAYRDWTAGLPDSVTSALKLLRLPPMDAVPEPLRDRLTVQLVVAHVGDPLEGERLAAPMVSAAPALLGGLRPMPYREVDALHMDPEDPIPVMEQSLLLDALGESAADELADLAGPDATSPLPFVEVRHLGGALARPAATPDMVAARGSAYSIFCLGILVPPMADLMPMAMAETVRRMAPYANGRSFANIHDPVIAGAERIRPWPDDVMRRRERVKRGVDPDDVFSFALRRATAPAA